MRQQVDAGLVPASAAAEVAKVKRYESGVLRDPITVAPEMTVREVIALAQARGKLAGVDRGGHGGDAVAPDPVDDGGGVEGIQLAALQLQPLGLMAGAKGQGQALAGVPGAGERDRVHRGGAERGAVGECFRRDERLDSETGHGLKRR